MYVGCNHNKLRIVLMHVVSEMPTFGGKKWISNFSAFSRTFPVKFNPDFLRLKSLKGP